MEMKMTTAECVDVARELLEDARAVNTREDHVSVWNRKVELLKVVNGALETGYYKGKAYEELIATRHILHQIEVAAGVRAMETYARED